MTHAASIATVCAVIALCRIKVYPITKRKTLEALRDALTVGKIEIFITIDFLNEQQGNNLSEQTGYSSVTHHQSIDYTLL